MQKKKPRLTVVKGKAKASPDSPPRPLGKHGSELWSRIVAEWIIDDEASREMLATACEAHDRAMTCAEIIEIDGPVVRLKTGQVREHPALRAELANRSFVVRTLARLGLAAESVKPIGRPPRSQSWTPDF